jgi:hypothetical protein
MSMLPNGTASASIETEQAIEVVKAHFDVTSGEGIFCFVNVSGKVMTAWTLREIMRYLDGRDGEGSITEDRYRATGPDNAQMLDASDSVHRAPSHPFSELLETHHQEGVLRPGQQHCIPASSVPDPDRPLADPPIEFEIVVAVFDDKEFHGDAALAERIFKKRAIQAVQFSHDALILRGVAIRIERGEDAQSVLNEAANERCPLLDSDDPYIQLVAETTHGQFLRAISSMRRGDTAAIEERLSELAEQLSRDSDHAYYNTTAAQFSAIESDAAARSSAIEMAGSSPN